MSQKNNKNAEQVAKERAAKIEKFKLPADASDEQIAKAEADEKRIIRAKAIGLPADATIEQIEAAEKVKDANGEDFVNPFAPGVSYEQFVKALGKKSVAEYLEGKNKTPDSKFDQHDFDWLNAEIEAHKNK